jgi:hypothetical protein
MALVGILYSHGAPAVGFADSDFLFFLILWFFLRLLFLHGSREITAGQELFPFCSRWAGFIKHLPGKQLSKSNWFVVSNF